MAEQSNARRVSLDLGELVDLEMQLRADRRTDQVEVRRRDERIGREICAEGDFSSRAYVLKRWLEALHPSGALTPGRRLAAAYRLGSYLLVALGLISGASAALALLRYDGGDPVNAVSYLAVFVALQLLLSAAAIISMLPARARGRLSPLGPLHAAMRELGVRRAGFDAAVERLGETAGADTGALKAWSAIYGEAERWRLLAITQRAAVAFNVGALVASLYAVAVRALAFAWSTTLDLDATTVHRATAWMSAPWGWANDAVPTLDLVVASRYFPGGQYDPALLGDWWPFLLASLITYGLLPRVALWLVAERRGRRLAAAIAFDHGDARAVYQRLTSGWEGDVSRDGAATAAGVVPRASASSITGVCRAFLWADVPLAHGDVETLVKRRTGCREVVVAKNFSESSDIDLAVEDALVVVAEAWEAPTRALGRFLADLRATVPTSSPIVVFLVGAPTSVEVELPVNEADAAVWRHYLAGLGDPYLFVDDGADG
jgi:hypothetical protein